MASAETHTASAGTCNLPWSLLPLDSPRRKARGTTANPDCFLFFFFFCQEVWGGAGSHLGVPGAHQQWLFWVLMGWEHPQLFLPISFWFHCVTFTWGWSMPQIRRKPKLQLLCPPFRSSICPFIFSFYCYKQPSLVEGVPAHVKGLEWDHLKGPSQPKPFNDSMILLPSTMCILNEFYSTTEKSSFYHR